jgi:hypothetical protein
MTREEFYNLWNVVSAIKAGEASAAALQPYSIEEIANAVKDLVNSEIEACAIIAEDASDEGGIPNRNEFCQQIARQIRNRRF